MAVKFINMSSYDDSWPTFRGGPNVTSVVNKNQFDEDFFFNWRFKMLTYTMELHWNGKILNLQFPIILDFFFKDWFSLVLLYLWVTEELIRILLPKMEILCFWRFFHIVYWICWHNPQLGAINYFFYLYMGSLYIETA